jgi:cytochrome c-type biogenesis protein CcmH
MLRALALTLALAFVPVAAHTQAPGDAPAATPAPALGVSPRDSALDAQTRALASELRCPVCQGQSLQDSGSELAREMRTLITEQLRSGESPAEVRAYFVSKYGEWILLQPEAHGFTLAVYLLPVLGLLTGAVVVFLAARRWTRPVDAGAAEAEEPTVSVSEDRS